MYLQINTVKYNADREIKNIYENLQIVWSKFFTDMLLFVYIWSTSNIDWFISIRIRCQWIQTNTYLVTFDYLKYLVRYCMNKPEGKKTTIRSYLIGPIHKVQRKRSVVNTTPDIYVQSTLFFIKFCPDNRVEPFKGLQGSTWVDSSLAQSLQYPSWIFGSKFASH